jgi:hypothetical protein
MEADLQNEQDAHRTEDFESDLEFVRENWPSITTGVYLHRRDINALLKKREKLIELP